MLWVIIVVLVCEVVVMLKLLLSYRQRAHRMLLVQDPLKQRIQKHKETLANLGQQIRKSTDEGVAKLEKRMAEQTMRCGYAGNTAADLDAEAREAQGVEEPDLIEEEGGDGIVGKVGGLYTVDLESDRLHPVEMIQSIRHELEDAHGGLEQQIEAVQNTKSQINEAMSRAPGRQSSIGHLLEFGLPRSRETVSAFAGGATPRTTWY